MRIPSGTTDQYIYFVAFSTADHVTRVAGLTVFTAIWSRDGSTGNTITGASVSAANSTSMAGVYKLRLGDSTMMTIGSGNDSEEVCVHLTSSMDPVTRTFELYRPKITLGNALVVDSSGAGNANAVEMGGTTLTARDIGASVLLSSGTGTGQITLTSGQPTVRISTGTGTGQMALNSGIANVNMTQVSGAAVNTTLPQLGVNMVSINGSTVATGTAQVGANVVSVSANAITASAIAADAIGASELASDAVAEIADGILDRNMATGTDSGSTTVRTPRQALRFLRNSWSISGGTLTVNKEDDSTASWTAAVTTASSADQITAIDPAGP